MSNKTNYEFLPPLRLLRKILATKKKQLKKLDEDIEKMEKLISGLERIGKEFEDLASKPSGGQHGS